VGKTFYLKENGKLKTESGAKNNSQLPKGWEYGVLGDAVKKGSSNISLNKIKDDEGVYPVFSAKGFAKKVSFFQQEQEYLAIIKDGAGIGRIAKYPAKSSVVATMQYLIPKEGFNISFIEYFLRGVDFEKHRSGSTIPHVYFKDYKSEPFPLIPLPEQQCIVEILDKAFVAIDKAKQNAEQNLRNAKEVFENYLQGVFESKGDNWEEKTLGEFCKIIGGGTPSKKKEEFYNGDILWATVRDMKVDLIEKTEHQITIDAINNSSTNIIPKGNVVIATRVGLGKVCVLKNDTAINQDLKGVIPINKNKLSIDFLFRWFKSISNQIINNGTGATVQGVKLTFINSLNISIPPIQEQKQIVQKLNSLSTQIKKLEPIYQQKIANLDELKKSILQKAFEGEL
jgi:type I restriction enzyme S subunit